MKKTDKTNSIAFFTHKYEKLQHQAPALLKRWHSARHRLEGCPETECSVCIENRKLIADTERWMKENKDLLLLFQGRKRKLD